MTDRHVLNVAVDRPYDVVVGRSLLDDVVNALPGAERIAIIHPAALSPTANAIADAFKGDARFTITIETPDAEAAKKAEAKKQAETEARLKEMERQRAEAERKANAGKPPTTAVTPPSTTVKPPTAVTPPPATVVKPDPKKVPVKPKEQRLKELLQLYLTDKITPREYHQQRAKILAEP